MPSTSPHAGNMDARVVCVGETMLMLAPPGHELLERASCFEVSIGGSEANVAIGLGRLGVHSAWIGRLPRNPLGRRVAQEIRAHGVDTSAVVWTEEGRVGLFFFEQGASPRPSVTLYDRANSAAASLTVEDLDWDHIRRAEWVHLSGISLALSPTCRESTREIIRRAGEFGLSVSFDLNHRALMLDGQEARQAWLEVLPFVNLLIATEEDATTLLGAGGLDRHETLRKLFAANTHRAVVMTLGEDGAVGFDGRAFCTAPGFEVQSVNRLGAGDAFVAGLFIRLRELQPGGRFELRDGDGRAENHGAPEPAADRQGRYRTSDRRASRGTGAMKPDHGNESPNQRPVQQAGQFWTS